MAQPTPSPAQLALALAVSKSRPKGMDLQDYIGKLRLALKTRTSYEAQQLDSIAFWKQAYETAESEQAMLHEKIHELEQRIGPSQGESSSSRPVESQHERKRKWQMKDQGSIDPFLEIEGFPADIGQQSDKSSRALACALFALREALKSNKPDRKELRNGTRRFCEVVSGMLSSMTAKHCRPGRAKRATQEAQKAGDDISRAATALRTCLSTLLQTVDKLPVPDADYACSDLAQLFQGILGHVHTLVANEIEMSSDIGIPALQNSSESAKHVKVLNSDIQQASRAMTSIASLFFAMLDTSRPSHYKLFEAFSCIFLDHLGSSLSLVVFSTPTPKKSNHLGILTPRGLLDTSDEDPQEAIRIAEHESEHLVLILRHVMRSLNRAKVSIGPGSTTMLGHRDNSTVEGKSFESRIIKRLQATLLRAVFGDEDQAFSEAFQRSDLQNTEVVGGQPQNHGRLDQRGFLGEVWDILGWHMLSGHSLGADH